MNIGEEKTYNPGNVHRNTWFALRMYTQIR